MATFLETQLEGYLLEVELSQNDQYTCYLGHQNADGPTSLIKVVNPLFASDEFFVRRFKQIILQVSHLEHPNIIRTAPALHERDQLAVVHDYVETQTLNQVIEAEGPFSAQRMQFIAEQIASALDYAHQKSVIHGELSADQIYLGPDDHVLITGFGETQAFFGTNLARNAYVISSPETVAPERVHGQGPSRPADLYALGIICYHMLAKKPPFTGPTSTVLHAQAHRQPRPLYQVNGIIPIDMAKAIGRMLSKGVELRYNTGAEFTRALAMAHHHKKGLNQFAHLAPISEYQRPLPFMTVFYTVAGLMLIIFVATLFAWAGYELGLRQAPAQALSPELMITTTILIQRQNDDIAQIVPTGALLEVNPVAPTTTPRPKPTSPTNALLPTATSFATRQLPTVTVATPTPSLPTLSAPPAPRPSAAPASQVPPGKGLFVFFNPTGYDLVVDVSGPISRSYLVPPNEQYEFVLEPGPYQYMVHTPTGEWLSPVVADFDLPPGQLVEKDYYSDYDWSRE
jgi:serine/threonine protein kinase